MDNFKHAIVITGSLGSGKSTVSNLLKERGLRVIDADEISHQILDNLSDEISVMFGGEFIKDDKPDREAIGKLVFNDKTELKKLESLLHPKIKSEILTQAQNLEKNNEIYFVDIPLYYESANYDEFKRVLVVYAPKDTLVRRVMRRNLLTKDEALARVNLQIDIETKRTLAHFVIDNSTNLDATHNQIDTLLNHLLKK